MDDMDERTVLWNAKVILECNWCRWEVDAPVKNQHYGETGRTHSSLRPHDSGYPPRRLPVDHTSSRGVPDKAVRGKVRDTPTGTESESQNDAPACPGWASLIDLIRTNR